MGSIISDSCNLVTRLNLGDVLFIAIHKSHNNIAYTKFRLTAYLKKTRGITSYNCIYSKAILQPY